MAARVQGAFPAGCHKTQAVPGGHKGRPYGGDEGAAGQTAFSNFLYPPREAADAARTRNARPYGENGEIAQKTAVCTIYPTFRGSWCGLRETLCSRNGWPILLARAKPGRGRQYGTGQPGGA